VESLDGGCRYSASDGGGKDGEGCESGPDGVCGGGGKVVLYHEWDDPAISPLNSIAYYESVQKTMGEEKVASFARLYRVLGMEHCIGGPGANLFGQLGAPSAKAPGMGALVDLQEWVEMGSLSTR
jgi:feruloyl esterase